MSSGQILVNFNRINEAYRQNPEAVDHTVKEEIAKTGDSELEQAMLEASFHAALAQLQMKAGTPGVMSTAEGKMASVLQTFLAQQAVQAGKTGMTATGILEAKFDNNDLLNWIVRSGFVSLFKSLRKFEWVKPPQIPDPLPTKDTRKFRLAVFGDWGTGLYGAPDVAKSISKDSIDVAIHLGDVYYSGENDEVQKRLEDLWPRRQNMLSRSLNGNHEMYSGGKAYLHAIQGFGQNSSCFYIENDSWMLVGLDTAYADHAVGWWSDGKLQDDEITWLSDLVSRAGKRKVVLFSHHQPYSLLDRQGQTLVSQMQPLLNAKQIFVWYWGHEHRCVLYDRHPQWQLYGRCVGHGGFPEFRTGLPGTSSGPTWVPVSKKIENITISGAVLDGANTYITEAPAKYLPNGYVTLLFENEHLTEFVHAPDGTEIRSPSRLA